MMPTIIWSGEVPPDAAEVERKIQENIAQYLNMDDYRSLVYHHVFLGEIDKAPCVLVTKGATAQEITCTYHATLPWEQDAELARQKGMSSMTSPAVRKTFS